MPAKNPLAAEADERIADCRAQKAAVELDLREAYLFTKPRLSRQVISTTAPTNKNPEDDTQLATGIGTESNEDFGTEVVNGFMPPHVDWVESKAGEGVPDEAWEGVKEAAKTRDGAVFKGIRASNFDAELGKALVPECGIGTVAIHIHDRKAHEPICCQHIPYRELEINIGPYGLVDDRFIVRWPKGRQVAALLPGVTLPAKVAEKIRRKPKERLECRWGWWRDWSEPDDMVWQYVVQVDGEIVTDQKLRGEGSCDLIVMRFAPDSLHAWGNGPTIDSLPMLRVVDKMAEATQNRADVSISPPIAYPDDGVMNFEDGLEAGKAYPKRPGSHNEIEPLWFTGDPSLGFYEVANLEKAIRRKHFADYPDQLGKTPPTATQWLDEMVKAQRRIGTPGQNFWREGPAEVFLRFLFLMSKRGTVQPLQVNGRDVAVRPSNPATKAQEQQEVQVATRVLDIAKGYFPQTSMAAIDEFATIENIKEKLGDRVVVLRDKQAATELVQQILTQGADMLQQQQGGQEKAA